MATRRKQRVYYKGGQVEYQERISSGCQPLASFDKIGAASVTHLQEGLPLPTSMPILQTSFEGLTRHNQGKVRDIYSFPDDGSVLLIVATDRISAFDYVLGSGIPDKGKVLTQLSAF